MTLPVLLDSAVRSLVLGFVVWALLKLTRLCDSRTETAVWTAVLVAALSMPVLCRHAPGLELPLPHLPAAASPAGTVPELMGGQRISPPHAGMAMSAALEWFGQHGRTLLAATYFLGLSAFVLRLGLGLALTLRLYRRATPVRAAWVQSRNVRASADIRSPVSLVGAIILPADHGEWSVAKRTAVLAHEESHIARGDFFVQLAATVHCAVFWFSPFAWWLQNKLADIAETASDEAAIRLLNDRTTYAEILVDVSRRAQESPLGVAMAKHSSIAQRIEHILSDEPLHRLTGPQRMFSVALLAALAIVVAGARAEVDPISNSPPSKAEKRAAKPVKPVAATVAAASPSATAHNRVALPTPAGGARAAHAARIVHAAEVLPGSAEAEAHTYDPRALLDPIYSPKTVYVPAVLAGRSGVHAGSEIYTVATARPVADVSVTYAMDRQVH